MIRHKAAPAPTYFRVFISAFFAILLGILLGFLHEARTAPTFSTDPVSRERAGASLSAGIVEIHQGRNQPVGNWEAALRTISQGGGNSSITLLEGDLNQIARRYMDFSGARTAAEGEDPNSAITRIHPSTPRIHLDGSVLQIATELDFSILAFTAQPWVILRGEFLEEERPGNFVVTEAWINSARVPPALGNLILARFLNVYKNTNEESPLIFAWNEVTSAKVSNSQLQLQLR